MFREILAVNSKRVTEFDSEEISDLLITIMIVCNFTITHSKELKAKLQAGENAPASIPELSQLFIEAASKAPNEMLTMDYLSKFLTKLTQKDKSMVIVDLNDELKLYQAETKEILRPQTALSKTYTEGFNDMSKKEVTLVNQRIPILNKTETEKMCNLDTSKSIRSLKSQLEPRIGVCKKSQTFITKERRIKILEEIFRYYTKHAAMANIRKTFELVQSELSEMSLGCILKFIKDFSIPIDFKKAKELFTKIAEAGRHLTFDKFLFLVEEFAFEVSKARILIMENERIIIGQDLEVLNQKLMIEENEESDLLKKKAEKLSKSVNILGEKIVKLKEASTSELVNEFYDFLGVNDLTVRSYITIVQRQTDCRKQYGL